MTDVQGLIYTLMDCPECGRRYALAPLRPGLVGVWDWKYPEGRCIAAGAGGPPVCVVDGAELKVRALAAVRTAGGGVSVLRLPPPLVTGADTWERIRTCLTVTLA